MKKMFLGLFMLLSVVAFAACSSSSSSSEDDLCDDTVNVMASGCEDDALPDDGDSEEEL